jgi:hypothetical protein
VQLLPQLIYFLKLDECTHAEESPGGAAAPTGAHVGGADGISDEAGEGGAGAAAPALLAAGGMDFASVLVYTCSSSCAPASSTSTLYSREHVVVIPEYRGKPYYLTWGGMFVKAECPPEVEAAGTNAKVRSRKGSDCSTPTAGPARSARDEHDSGAEGAQLETDRY